MAKRFLGWVVAAGLAGCAAEPAAQEASPAVEITLSGAVAKGPFLLGSSVAITPAAMRANENSAVATTSGAARASGEKTVTAEPRGDAQGQVFRTETANDLGEFELQVAYQGGALIEANGFYYNEYAGELSHAPLTLRAFHELGATDATVQVNLITHLTYQRVQALVADGATVGEAHEQAETELHAALGLGQGPAKAGSEISLIAGDDDASAYLFAVSTIFTAAGRTDAGTQELLNTTAAAFATAGSFPAAIRDRLEEARRDFDNTKVEAAFAARLAATGSTAAVPDLDRVIPWMIPASVQTCADTLPTSFDETCRLTLCGNDHRRSAPGSLESTQALVSTCDDACWTMVACANEKCAEPVADPDDAGGGHLTRGGCLVRFCDAPENDFIRIGRVAEWVASATVCN